MMRERSKWFLLAACFVGSMIARPVSAQFMSCAYLFEHVDYRGTEVIVGEYEGIREFDGSFNDRMSSIIVEEGCYCSVHIHAGYQGETGIVDARDSEVAFSHLDDDWNDNITSIVCMRVED